jgi:hypothetical protein
MPAARLPLYERSVFINCPFDEAYKPLFDATIFAIHDCGFFARHALESVGGREPRLEKILRLIAQSRYSIHDVSRVELDRVSKLPRFNMPFECGLAFGAMHFAAANKKTPQRDALVMSGVRYQDKVAISDLAGIDPRYHGNDPEAVIASVRQFLADKADGQTIRGHRNIGNRLRLFQAELPAGAALQDITAHEIGSLEYINDWTQLASTWMVRHPR